MQINMKYFVGEEKNKYKLHKVLKKISDDYFKVVKEKPKKNKQNK